MIALDFLLLIALIAAMVMMRGIMCMPKRVPIRVVRRLRKRA